ncbi:hypothetical protein [Thalassotalea profundi]|uniref:Uncharacterized protein n=1 Tax=Thalassotalea profundi TaxID=2036687 RepID=A0ABQ3IIJ7_9GAMM|nr:hypothetical protein [Thalassotalea profundi]GHE84901.1 hypothetical protein GCM10011501_12230 [Thalassotalea profundi]
MKFIRILLIIFSCSTFASDEIKPTTAELETQIKHLQNRLYFIEQSVLDNSSALRNLSRTAQDNILVLVLFAFFCAWWAKTTDRNSVLWFFLGLLFNVFTAIAIVLKTEPKPRYR